jgi:hypothetical protein
VSRCFVEGHKRALPTAESVSFCLSFDRLTTSGRTAGPLSAPTS